MWPGTQLVGVQAQVAFAWLILLITAQALQRSALTPHPDRVNPSALTPSLVPMVSFMLPGTTTMPMSLPLTAPLMVGEHLAPSASSLPKRRPSTWAYRRRVFVVRWSIPPAMQTAPAVQIAAASIAPGWTSPPAVQPIFFSPTPTTKAILGPKPHQ